MSGRLLHLHMLAGVAGQDCGMAPQCVGVPIATASMSGSSSNRRKSVSTVGPVSCRAATDETA